MRVKIPHSYPFGTRLAGAARSATRGLVARSPAVRRNASFLLMAAGVVLLFYVGTQYAAMYNEQRRLSREWEKQNQAAPPAAVRDDGLIKLAIPKIKLDAIVVEGTSHRQLLLGPGHMTDTPAPGEAGNSVITAHRDTFFRHIYELNRGDSIEVRRRGRLYTYEVTGKKVVQPDDLSVLQQGQGKRLTLITCYPTYFIGPAPERLVVFAKLQENTPAGVNPAGGAR